MRSISIRRPLLVANALESVILRHPSLVYRSLSIVLSEGKHGALMRFEGSPEALRTLRDEYVTRHPKYILRIEVVQESSRSMTVYKTEKSGKGPVEIAGIAYEHFGSQCVARVTKDVAGAQWDILTFDDAAVPAFLDELRSRGTFTELKSQEVTAWKLSRFAQAHWSPPVDVMSAQEEKTIRRAAKLGYFDSPRRADVRTVARALRLPHSTVHHHLRRATNKIVLRMLEGL